MAATRLLMIDHVDSFTFMLVDLLRGAGADVVVVRHDSATVDAALARDFHGVVISPGPGRPESATTSIAIARACIDAGRPLLGICLGHQIIALAAGGRVDRVPPVHGKAQPIHHDGSGLFAGLRSPFPATRYHSLAVGELPETLSANAWTADRIVMGLRHRTAPAHGIQFHPESIASEQGAELLSHFVALAGHSA